MSTLHLLLALLVSPTAHSLTRPEAVEFSKSRILGIVPHFSSLAYNCFEFEEECQIEPGSQSATIKWLNSEAAEHEPKIQFDSGAEKFLIDGAVRIAKTGRTWGAPVIFNEDLLAVETSPGNFEALGFFETLAILIHEYGHHQDFYLRQSGLRPLEHHELDLIAVRVVAYLKDRTRRLHLGPAEIPGLAPENSVNIYQIDREWYNGIRNKWSLIFVDSRAETKEISPELLLGLKCPLETDNGHITFRGEAYYAAFRQVRSPKISFSSQNLSVEQAVGAASAFCVDKFMGVFQVFDGYTDGMLRLQFNRNVRGLWEVNTNSSRFTATPPPDIHH